MEDDELRLIWLYCWLDGVVGAVTGEVGRLRERGPAPKLTDAEVLTIMIWGEILGLPSDAAIWRAAKSLLVGWFPCMVAEWNFVRRCANLIAMKDRILVLGFGPAGDFNSFDGLPLPVCKNARAPRDRRFKGEAAWSFCAAKDEYYYGFKAGALANSNDEIFRVWLGPANVDERDMLESTAFGMPGPLLADKGMISPVLHDLLAGRGIDLVTPLRRNMKDDRPKWVVRQAMRLRRRIETVFGRLVTEFGIARTKGRDFWRWSARILRKILAYNLLIRYERLAAAA
jgi:hypothetical protein